MSGAAFLRLKKLKGSGILLKAARHNRRVIQAEMGATGSIDPTRSALNETLQGPPSADDVARLAKDLMRDAGIGKLRKDAVMGLELVFSLPPDHPGDYRAFFSDCAAWAESQFGGARNILSVDIHRDEAQPHCHVLVLPLKGRKLAGSEMAGNRHQLLAMQSHFFGAVAARHGLRKAPARLQGANKKAATAATLQKLRETGDPVLGSAVWPTVRAAIENDPAPFLVPLGIVLSAQKKALRTMAQIFTSKGKGKAVEAKPIGFAGRQSQSLSCVGFASILATPTPDKVPDCPVEPQSVRVRDCDLDPASFNPETGDFEAPRETVSPRWPRRIGIETKGPISLKK